MGFLEDLETMDLADDVKAKLRQAHTSEVDPLKGENTDLKEKDRRERVTTEIKEFSDAGWEAAPAALAYARRVFLSPDAEEIGAVLLSDAELQLSGDEATGARVKEDVSAATVLRTFMSLLPKSQEGKLTLALSDQGVVADDHGRPNTSTNNKDADPEVASAEHRTSLGKSIGREIGRPSRSKRYGGTVVAGVTGGDA